jgi:hypothetical protein
MHFHAHGRDGARSPQVIEGKKVRKGLATPEAVPPFQSFGHVVRITSHSEVMLRY